MPVVQTVTTAPMAASNPAIATQPPVRPSSTQPMPNSPAGTKVTTEATPSRDSQELRHCEKARQARSGRPRWPVDDKRPAAIRPSASPMPTSPSQKSGGMNPESAEHAKQREQAVTGARGGGEEDDGEGWMHGMRQFESMRSTQPRKPPSARTGSSAGAGTDAARCGVGARRQVFVGRVIAEFRHQVDAAALRHQLRDRRRGIAEIAEMPGAGRAGGDAGRHAVFLGQIVVVDAVDAQRAFLHHADIGVELARAVGAGPAAQFAADALVLVDQHDAVRGPLVGGAGRADGDAGRRARNAGRSAGS